jgi:beta-glucosidase
VTLLQGIKEAVGDQARVLYAQGAPVGGKRDVYLNKKFNNMSEAAIVADNSDVIVLCVGLDYNYEGEQGDTGNSDAAGDKLDLLLPPIQRELQELVEKSGKPVIYCMLTGSAMDLSYARDHFNAIFQVWYPGAEGGRAFADLLLGKVSPSGKLPITLYETVEELPEFTDYSMKGRTYRYMEQKAQYPFGFGLTYGDVIVTNAVYENGAVRATVTNSGAMDTEDVVQVYIKGVDSPNATLNPTLCAFKRVFVAAGETKEVVLPIEDNAFTVVNDAGERVMETSYFHLYVGMSSEDKACMILVDRNKNS